MGMTPQKWRGRKDAMGKKILCVVFALLILGVAFATSMADTIVLKSGKVIEGDIVEETEDLVAVEIYDSGATGFFSKEDIKSINKQRVDVARGRIIEATGDVEVLPKGETEWKRAEEGMSLDEGYSIRSGPDSKAIAVFAEQVIMAVEPESEIDLQKLQKSRRTGINFKMDLNKGQLWNDVGKLRSKRSKFFVETPQAVTGVRGTVFTVHVSPDAKTRVGVVEGAVDVRTIGLTIMPTIVGENAMTEVSENEAPVAPGTISEDYLAQWDGYKSRFQRIRLEMAAGGLGELPMPVLLGLAALAAIIVIFLLSRLLRRRKA
jgi:hypothetical protein